MKFLILSICLASSAFAFGKDCEVYGISDSPQKLLCTFPKQEISLSCKNGNYYLNSSKVKLAYHLEVEEGPTPLVFETNDMKMIVVIEDKLEILAELDLNRTSSKGTCL